MKITDLLADLEAAERQIVDHRNDIESAIQSIVAAREQTIASARDADQTETEVARRERELEDLRADLERLSGEEREMQASVAEQRTLLASTRERRISFEERATQLAQTIITSGRTAEQARNRAAEIRETLVRLQQELVEAEQTASFHDTQREQARAEHPPAERAFLELRETERETAIDLEGRERDIRSLGSATSRLASSVDAAERSIDDLRARLEIMQATRSAAQARFAEQNAALERARLQLSGAQKWADELRTQKRFAVQEHIAHLKEAELELQRERAEAERVFGWLCGEDSAPTPSEAIRGHSEPEAAAPPVAPPASVSIAMRLTRDSDLFRALAKQNASR